VSRQGEDPLDGARRIIVAGTSGSGKTTLARGIADALGIERVELDSLYHGPGWIPRPEFEAEVDAFIAGDAWVTEWQYRVVRERLAARAELLVWLDLPRRVVMTRIVRRTVWRRIRRVELWNGNQEGPLRELLHDRDHIIRWSWRTHPTHAAKVADAAAANAGLRVVRLRSAREVDAWLESLIRR
jgi:adenylate kinase family enzyme